MKRRGLGVAVFCMYADSCGTLAFFLIMQRLLSISVLGKLLNKKVEIFQRIVSIRTLQ